MRRKIIWCGVLWMFMAGSFGCASVKPYQREYLADRIMDPRSNLREARSDQKWLSTREGALGGNLGVGGGCACN